MTTTKDELEALSKSELIELVLKRQSTAAAAVPAAAAAPAAAAPPAAAPAVAKTSKSEHKKARAFDMSRYAQRHTALRVAYLGAAYSGSAYTPGADTVAGRLLEACTKTCLIADRESCGLTLGGRTDKGVSAFGQVFALRLRSNLPQAAGTSEASGGAAAAAERKEIDYVRVLNRVLPEDIRVLAAQPVPEDFSARFSATHRTYRCTHEQSSNLRARRGPDGRGPSCPIRRRRLLRAGRAGARADGGGVRAAAGRVRLSCASPAHELAPTWLARPRCTPWPRAPRPVAAQATSARSTPRSPTSAAPSSVHASARPPAPRVPRPSTSLSSR